MLEIAVEEKQVKSRVIVGTLLSKFGSLLALVLLSLTFSILTPRFLTINNIMNIANQTSINALLAFGVLFPILTAGIDLSVGAILAISIMTMGVVVVNFGLNPIIGILVCLVVGALFGLLNGLLLTKLRLPHPFISTLGTMNIARGLALIITGAAPIAGFPLIIQYFGSGMVGGVVPFSFILVLVIAVVLHIFLNRTETGRYIYAIGGNSEAARLSGINVDKVLLIVYSLSGLMAGFAGLVMVGRVNSAFPLAGVGYELDAIAAVIIGGASLFGGIGTIWGTLIGALIIAVLRNGLNLLDVPADLQLGFIGVVVIVAVYVDVLRQRTSKNKKVKS